MRISDWSSDVCSSDLVNDVRGHAAGDDVLRSVAAVLRECIGDRGHAVRYGGDEFAVALDVDEPQALEIAESIRRRVGERSEEHTSEIQSLMRISYAVFCLKKQKRTKSTERKTGKSNG